MENKIKIIEIKVYEKNNPTNHCFIRVHDKTQEEIKTIIETQNKMYNRNKFHYHYPEIKYVCYCCGEYVRGPKDSKFVSHCLCNDCLPIEREKINEFIRRKNDRQKSNGIL